MRARAVFTIKNRESLCLVALAASRSGSSERQRRRRYYQRFYKQHDDWKKIEVAGHVVVYAPFLLCSTIKQSFLTRFCKLLKLLLQKKHVLLCRILMKWWCNGERSLFNVCQWGDDKIKILTLSFQNCILFSWVHISIIVQVSAKTGFWPLTNPILSLDFCWSNHSFIYFCALKYF